MLSYLFDSDPSGAVPVAIHVYLGFQGSMRRAFSARSHPLPMCTLVWPRRRPPAATTSAHPAPPLLDSPACTSHEPTIAAYPDRPSHNNSLIFSMCRSFLFRTALLRDDLRFIGRSLWHPTNPARQTRSETSFEYRAVPFFFQNPQISYMMILNYTELNYTIQDISCVSFYLN